MKIAHILDSLSHGGSQRVVSNLTTGVFNIHDNFIIIPKNATVDYPFKGVIIRLDIEINHFLIKKFKNRFIKSLIMLIRLRKIKKAHKFDLVISHLENMNFYNIVTRCSEKIYIVVHNTKSIELSYYRFVSKMKERVIILFFYRFADKIISVSEGVRIDLINNYCQKQNKLVTIYNPFDCQDIIEQSSRNVEIETMNQFDFNVIVVGRLDFQKNIKFIIDAFEKFRSNLPNFKLYVLGTGPEENELRKYTQDLGIEKDVIFLGFRLNPYYFIRNSDVLVLASHYEGFGNVIVESMILETPVIAVDCLSGPREIICNNCDYNLMINDVKICDNGILIPRIEETMNSEYLVNALTIIYNDTDLVGRLKKNAYNASLNYDVSRISFKWNDLFSKDELT